MGVYCDYGLAKVKAGGHFSTVDGVKDQKRIQDVRVIQMCPPVLRRQFGILSRNHSGC